MFEPTDDENDDETGNDETDEEIEPELILAEPAVDQEEMIMSNTNNVLSGPKQSKKYIITRMNSAASAANKVKEKYKKQQQQKVIGHLNKQNKASADWLKAAGYLETENQNAVEYVYVPPKNNVSNDDNNNNNKKETEPVGDVIDLKNQTVQNSWQLKI